MGPNNKKLSGDTNSKKNFPEYFVFSVDGNRITLFFIKSKRWVCICNNKKLGIIKFDQELYRTFAKYLLYVLNQLPFIMNTSKKFVGYYLFHIESVAFYLKHRREKYFNNIYFHMRNSSPKLLGCYFFFSIFYFF